MSIGSGNVPDLAGAVPRCTGPPASTFFHQSLKAGQEHLSSRCVIGPSPLFKGGASHGDRIPRAVFRSPRWSRCLSVPVAGWAQRPASSGRSPTTPAPCCRASRSPRPARHSDQTGRRRYQQRGEYRLTLPLGIYTVDTLKVLGRRRADLRITAGSPPEWTWCSK
jgi:hypothetical protein